MRLLIVCIFILSGSLTACSITDFPASPPFPPTERLEPDHLTKPAKQPPASLNQDPVAEWEQAQKALKQPESNILTEQLEQAQQAVWIISGHTFYYGTAFFISPRRVITNWHVISGQDMDTLSLQQEGDERELSIKRLISVSVLHDLALLETKEDSTHYLTVREDIVSDEEKLFLLGYPGQAFKYTLKTSPLKNFNNDDIFTYFHVNRTNINGNSGGPVLDANSKVVGVAQGGNDNLVRVIKGSILRQFIAGDMGIGLNCGELAEQACIEKEINNLQEQATGGSQIAQYQLAKMYYRVNGVEQDPSSAQKWLQQAAEQGYALAQHDLGAMYYNGEGVQKDFHSALKWWRLAAEQGVTSAQYNLGVMYYKGEGVQKDFHSALKWSRLAAEQGVTSAQYNLGVMYLKGAAAKMKKAQEHNLIYLKRAGVDEDLSLALKWLRLAAEQGHAAAQELLQSWHDLVESSLGPEHVADRDFYQLWYLSE